jgi:hypothetical protein
LSNRNYPSLLFVSVAVFSSADVFRSLPLVRYADLAPLPGGR